MRVILLERVSKLGQMGDVVNVKSGYARNFLLPRSKAAPATKEHIDSFNQRRVQLETHNLETKDEAIRILKKVETVKPTIIAQASETKQLYGSVKARDIATAINEQGVTISHKQIILLPVKVLGLHRIKIELHPEVSTDILICVASSDEEALTYWERGEVTSQENTSTPAIIEFETSDKETGSNETDTVGDQPQNDDNSTEEQPSHTG